MKIFISFAMLMMMPFQQYPTWASESIVPGVYKLIGSNPHGNNMYVGRILIQKEGRNYRVTWLIGALKNQAQVGIGILQNRVLSVGYLDASGQDFGVASLRIINSKHLKGQWASLLSTGSHGEEEFIFETEKIPAEYKPDPIASEFEEEQTSI